MTAPTWRAALRAPRSLTARLTLALSVATLAIALLSGVLSYRQAVVEAGSLQDDTLRQVGAIVATTTVPPAVLSTDRGVLTDAASDLDLTSLSSAGLPPDAPAGLVEVTSLGQARRVLVVHRAEGGPVAVSQSLAVRDEIAHQSAVSAVLPLVLLLPVLVLTIAATVRLVLRPVDRLASEIAAREPRDLGPLDVEAGPAELRGFLRALDAQFTRAQESVDHERLFIAQASHELRTPLTAMSLQLENAVSAPDDEHLRVRLLELRRGVERSRHLVHQLLDLARAQADPTRRPTMEGLDVVIRQVLGEVLPLADLHGVDLEVVDGADLRDPVPAAALTSVLRNLVDNAVRYSPRASVVRLSAQAADGQLTLSVEDDGPGIRDPDAALRPFTREASGHIPGSGLGLAVVDELVRHLGGSWHIAASRPDGTGTVVRVSLPRDPSTGGS